MKSKTLDQIFTGRRRRFTPIIVQFPGVASGLLTAYLVGPPDTLGNYTAIPVTWINDRWTRSSVSKEFPVTGSRAVQIVK